MTTSTVGRLGAALLLAFGTANAQSSVFKLDSDGKLNPETSIVSDPLGRRTVPVDPDTRCTSQDRVC